jgi:hypothetical protein
MTFGQTAVIGVVLALLYYPMSMNQKGIQDATGAHATPCGADRRWVHCAPAWTLCWFASHADSQCINHQEKNWLTCDATPCMQA